jgi:hypothetical protein
VVSKESTYLVSFVDAGRAKVFVLRLHINLSDIATLRDGVDVIVLDASERGHRERIMQLARESNASHVVQPAPNETISLRKR